MSEVHVVWNEYTSIDGSSGMEIVEIWSTREEADIFLDAMASGMKGKWNDSQSVFSIDNSMPEDLYYVETREVKGKG